MNTRIISDEAVETTETSRQEAEAMGAIAFFGDKYGDTVRVVRAGTHSLEFCGGTHVGALGSIGSFSILSEGSIGSNTRRIEAVTGLEAVDRLLHLDALVTQAAAALRGEPEAIVEGIDRLSERVKTVEKERDSLRQAALSASAHALLEQVQDGVIVAELEGVAADDLRTMASDLQRRDGVTSVALGSVSEGKVAIAVATDVAKNAKDVVKEIGPLIGGGGGGSPTLAVAGGKQPEGLAEGLERAGSLLRSQ